MAHPRRNAAPSLVLLACLPALGEGFDWERDAILLRNGKEERGVVLQSFDPEHVLLLRKGNRREEIPRAAIQRIDLLRDRLAAFLGVRRAGLSAAAEWDLVEDAERAGLARMARLQAYHVLLREPGFARAHEFLGHERAGSAWLWTIDGKRVSAERFAEMGADWNHRIVLESEHFTLETDCGLRRGLDVLFDLEGLYVWWMAYLGPHLRAAEDVDDPLEERMTFLVHRGPDDPSFLQQDSDREPYYDPRGGRSSTTAGGINVARTYYLEGERPLRLFELATEVLMYSTLVLGRTLDEADHDIRLLSHWAEVGLGYWVAQHCRGAPGYPEIERPFDRPFVLDPETARTSLAELRPPHVLLKGPSELANLVDLPSFELDGSEPSVPLARARCCSFVSFLLEVDQPLRSGESSARHALWRYLREVYCTHAAYSSSAFDAGLGGGKVAMFEKAWKSWTAGFVP